MTMPQVFVDGFFVWGASFGWAMYCNSATYQDRKLAIDRIFKQKKLADLSENFHSVSYARHLWARILFRNPWELYSPALQSTVGQMHS